MVKKLTFLSNCPIELNFGPSSKEYISLRTNSLRAKIEVKTDEISTKYQKP